MCITMTSQNNNAPILIVDLQGFQYNNSDFILKELATMHCNTNQQSHYVFKPPQSFSTLARGEQAQYRWLENHYHGLRWSNGHTHLSDLPNILSRLCTENVVIVCKGRMKKDFLQHYLPQNKIINLDDCPIRLPSLKLLDVPKCLEHVKEQHNHCALTNVSFLNYCIVNLDIKLY